MKRFALAAILACQCASAEVYMASVSEAMWTPSGAKSQCMLTHEIPQWGQAQLKASKDGRTTLYLQADMAPQRSASITLLSEAPQWRQSNTRQELFSGQWPARAHRLSLTAALTQDSIDSLERGQAIALEWRDASGKIAKKIALAPVRFKPALLEFQACMQRIGKGKIVTASLGSVPRPSKAKTKAKTRASSGQADPVLPAWQSRRQRSLYFSGAQTELSAEHHDTLFKMIADYLLLPESTQIQISGLASANPQIAERTAMVREHLIQQGVPAEAIQSIQDSGPRQVRIKLRVPS